MPRRGIEGADHLPARHIGAHSSNREVKERKHPRAEFNDERHLLWKNVQFIERLDEATVKEGS